MTPEGKIKKVVKEKLKAAGAYSYMPVTNGMGAPSLDFLVCHRGRWLGIETKAGNKQPTERQLNTMLDMQMAGGKTLLINEVEGLEELERWLNE